MVESVSLVEEASLVVGETQLDEAVKSETDVSLDAALIEALLLAHGDPLSFDRLLQISKLSESDFKTAVKYLVKRRLEDSVSGFEVVETAQCLHLRTKTQFAAFVRELKSEPPRRLSAAALETLAVIAYRQPIVRSDIEKIRGVDSTPTLKTLLDRSLISIAGHASSVGQPALYVTTEEFLSLFGLKAVDDLPSIRDLRELERDPGESDGSESAGGESEGSESEGSVSERGEREAGKTKAVEAESRAAQHGPA